MLLFQIKLQHLVTISTPENNLFVPYLDYIERENIILVFERLVNKGKLPEAIQNELKTLPHPRLQAVFGTVSQEEQDVEADSDSENSEYDSS